MMGVGHGMEMKDGATATNRGVNSTMAQNVPGMRAMQSARQKLKQELLQIEAENALRQQQMRGGQYTTGVGLRMGNPPRPNYQPPQVDPATGGMSPGAPGGIMTTHNLQQQMMLRHQQEQQRRLQLARFQQLQMHRQAAAMQQMAAEGHPAAAGVARGQHPSPSPLQANPPTPMGQMMQVPQPAQYYVQQSPRPGNMMTSGLQPPMGYQPGVNPSMPGQPPMAAGGYPNPAGIAQGQQFAMHPALSPMQTNSPMPVGQMMQTPQQAQYYYAQQPPGPGMMMPGAPRPPMGYQPGMNPGQPPTYR